MARTGSVIAEIKPDIIALQEVDLDQAGRTLTALDELKRKTSLRHRIWGPTLASDIGQYGNLVLSSVKPIATKLIEISRLGREPRGLIKAAFDWRGRRLNLIAAHLGLGFYERQRQVGRLIDLLKEDEDGVTILMGDFNDWIPGNPQLRRLNRQLGESPRRRTFPSRAPLLPLDRIWVKPSRLLVNCRPHRSPAAMGASDHLPLVGLLDFGASRDD